MREELRESLRGGGVGRRNSTCCDMTDISSEVDEGGAQIFLLRLMRAGAEVSTEKNSYIINPP
jgi:hypothetical protein